MKWLMLAITVVVGFWLWGELRGDASAAPTPAAPSQPATVAATALPSVQPAQVACRTTKGPLQIVVRPDWSPQGAARFLQLVDDGYFKDIPLFRCVAGFVCQFGATPPRADAKAYPAIGDDPILPELRHFKAGYLSFAGAGANTRATQLFITLGDKVDSLGTQPWESPFGYVTDEAMQATVARFNTRYGDIPPWGAGPDPQRIQAEGGAAYLKHDFPELDYITDCARQ
ncbi:hypothetical protein GCM10007860_23030 [Chitiniphilus shinanonensis]|uniref:PPIase cyclophilin-type domain-containing protein n=1 Tax=Chitiniphilus shinanonensis TaxID=553088 RepID=A0ABQ6BT28_9NEIS|nr:peptidylprolyl isomerase [Chitiniphilus shinanonensis]GLS05153.1 hypothetical protein GCM10007860_23030 [Chitiniphilus shinanonensis]